MLKSQKVIQRPVGLLNFPLRPYPIRAQARRWMSVRPEKRPEESSSSESPFFSFTGRRIWYAGIQFLSRALSCSHTSLYEGKHRGVHEATQRQPCSPNVRLLSRKCIPLRCPLRSNGYIDHILSFS